MFRPRAPQLLALLLGLLVVLVVESQNIDIENTTEQLLHNELNATQIAEMLLVNQMVLLKMLSSSGNEFELDLEVGSNDITIDMQSEWRSLKAEAIEEMEEVKTRLLEELPKQCPRSCNRYTKYDIKATQVQAVQACKDLGGRIALPLDMEDDIRIKQILGVNPDKKPWRQYWIGGTDEEQEGKWVDSVTGKPMTFLNFKKGEPNNDGGNEDCICVSPGYFGWIDCSCDLMTAGYVCEFSK